MKRKQHVSIVLHDPEAKRRTLSKSFLEFVESIKKEREDEVNIVAGLIPQYCDPLDWDLRLICKSWNTALRPRVVPFLVSHVKVLTWRLENVNYLVGFKDQGEAACYKAYGRLFSLLETGDITMAELREVEPSIRVRTKSWYCIWMPNLGIVPATRNFSETPWSLLFNLVPGFTYVHHRTVSMWQFITDAMLTYMPWNLLLTAITRLIGVQPWYTNPIVYCMALWQFPPENIKCVISLETEIEVNIARPTMVNFKQLVITSNTLHGQLAWEANDLRRAFNMNFSKAYLEDISKVLPDFPLFLTEIQQRTPESPSVLHLLLNPEPKLSIDTGVPRLFARRRI